MHSTRSGFGAETWLESTRSRAQMQGDKPRNLRYSAVMEVIATSEGLARACERLSKHPVITVDTEFLRETTYYPLLCVIQMASVDEAVVIDALGQGMDLAPFFALMGNEQVLKVFHAARQDIE